MKKESSGYTNNETQVLEMTEEQKRADQEWRAKDKKRLVASKQKANQVFEKVVMPFLESAKVLSNPLSCEDEGAEESIKLLDEHWGIDWIAEREGHKIGIAARISGFEGFTLRERSRGYRSEVEKFAEYLENKLNPFDPSKVYLFQVETMVDSNGIKQPYMLHMIKMEKLFQFIREFPNDVVHRVNKQDGNTFIYIPSSKLELRGFKVVKAQLPKKGF